jgi:hypothetical protein
VVCTRAHMFLLCKKLWARLQTTPSTEYLHLAPSIYTQHRGFSNKYTTKKRLSPSRQQSFINPQIPYQQRLNPNKKTERFLKTSVFLILF